MESFEPLINLIVVLTVLSVIAERATNLLKLRNQDLRMRKLVEADERVREYAITGRAVMIGIIVAILVKADFFQLVANLDSPWRTLGWVQVYDYHWSRSPATANIGTFLYALAGSVLTGVGLGFGSKFWHGVLGTMIEIRSMARKYREQQAPAPPIPSAPQGDKGIGG